MEEEMCTPVGLHPVGMAVQAGGQGKQRALFATHPGRKTPVVTNVTSSGGDERGVPASRASKRVGRPSHMGSVLKSHWNCRPWVHLPVLTPGM